MGRKPLAITADLHLHEHAAFSSARAGYNSRLLDCEMAWMEICRKSFAAGVETILFAGDWFHSRKNVSIPCLEISERMLRATKKMGLRVVAINGNHDLSLDGKDCSIRGQPFTNVYTLSPAITIIDGWRVGLLPWTDSDAAMRASCRRFDKEKVDFTIGHAGIDSAKVGPSDFEVHGHVLPEHCGKSLTFLGHYHKAQSVTDTIHYVGSPLQLSWGESGESKSFVLMQPTGEWSRVPLTDAPQFVKADASNPDKDGRSQDFVRYTAETAQQAAVLNTMMQKRGMAALRKVVLASAPPEFKLRSNIAGASLGEQVRAWIEYEGVPDGFTLKEIEKLGRQLLAI